MCEIRLASPSKLSCQLHLSFTHAVSALVDLPDPEHQLKPERSSIYGSVGILSSKLRKTVILTSSALVLNESLGFRLHYSA